MSPRADRLPAGWTWVMVSQSTKNGARVSHRGKSASAVSPVRLSGRVTSTSRPWPAFRAGGLDLTRCQIDRAGAPSGPAIRRPLTRAPAGRAAADPAASVALEGPRTAALEGADWQAGVGQVMPARRPQLAYSASTLEGTRSGTPPSVPWASPYSLGALRPQTPALTFLGG